MSSSGERFTRAVANARKKRWRIAGLSLLIIGVVVACERDAPTAPGRGVRPPEAPLTDIEPPPLEDPDPMRTPGAFALTIGTPNPYGDANGLVGDITRPMVVAWRIKQKVIETDKWHPESHTWIAYPAGFNLAFACNLRARIYWRGPTGQEYVSPQVGWCGSTEQETGQLVTLGVGQVWGARGSGTGVGCGGPCYNYSGSTTWSVIPYKISLKVTASPSLVMAGDTVTFVASRTDGSLPAVERWIWVAKDTTHPPQTVACATTSTTCRTPVYEDGWMFAKAVINGALETDRAGVGVLPPELTVTVNPTRPKRGSEVMYKAMAIPFTSVVEVTRWRFVPDDTTMQPTEPCAPDYACFVTATVGGTMWAYGILDGRWSDSASAHVIPYTEFTLYANKSTIAAGEVVTFTPRIDGDQAAADYWLWKPADGSTEPSGCTDGANACQRAIQASGTMWAYLAPGGVITDSASAQIVVDPCLGSGTASTSASSPERLAPSRQLSASSGQLSSAATATCSPPPQSVPLVMSLTTSLDPLHPRIRANTVNGLAQPEVEPEATTINLTVTRSGQPVPAASVTIRGELIPDTAGRSGGHGHVTTALRLEEIPRATGGSKYRVAGHFSEGGLAKTSITGTSNASGTVTTLFRAGYLGGRLRIIGSATLGTESVMDTVEVTVRVPNLVNAGCTPHPCNDGLVTGVYWIGGTPNPRVGGPPIHPQGVNWYVRPDLIDEVQTVAYGLQKVLEAEIFQGQMYYPQFNDISLPFGGAFTETINETLFDDPYESHTSHTHGVDIDIAFCRVPYEGNDNQARRASGTTCTPAEARVRDADVEEASMAAEGEYEVHNRNHYHIRFRVGVQ